MDDFLNLYDDLSSSLGPYYHILKDERFSVKREMTITIIRDCHIIKYLAMSMDTGVGMTIINRWRHQVKAGLLPGKIATKAYFEFMIAKVGFEDMFPAGGALNVLQIFASVEGTYWFRVKYGMDPTEVGILVPDVYIREDACPKCKLGELRWVFDEKKDEAIAMKLPVDHTAEENLRHKNAGRCGQQD